jgi:hypothetical protein
MKTIKHWCWKNLSNNPSVIFCSSDIAITYCINCGHHSCGRYIYCCQKIQTNINDNSVICNMCFIGISHKLQPYKYKKKNYKKHNFL